MIPIIVLATGLILAPPALAQQQEARAPTGQTGQTIYDMVTADRETAWRINRLTGEVMICRVNTTAGLDTVSATCAMAGMGGGGAQQSQVPAAAAPSPATGGGGGARP